MRLPRKRVGMRGEECRGQCPRAHPPAQGESRTRCGEKQERVRSVEAEENLRRAWVTVAVALKS